MCLPIILCLILSIGSAIPISPAITYPTGLCFQGNPLAVSKHYLFPHRSVGTSRIWFQRKPVALQIKLRSHDRFVTLAVSKHCLFPHGSVETIQIWFQRKPDALQIKLRSLDRFVTSCSGSQYNEPEEIARSETDSEISLQKYVSEPEDTLMKEVIRVGSAVLISHILEMFVNAKGKDLANEDRQEVDSLISLLRQNLPGMQQFIVLVSNAVAAKYPEHRDKIIGGGQVLLEVLNLDGKLSNDSPAIRAMLVGFFERYLMRQFRLFRYQLEKRYPFIIIPEDDPELHNNLRLLILILIAAMIKPFLETQT